MKKVIVFVLVAALALTAVFAQGASESSSKSYTIHLITMDQMDQHWVACNQGAQDAGKELGVKVVFNSPDTKDDNKQIECINNSVAQGADAILVAANAPDSQVSALKEAAAAGVKIVYVDSPANFESLRLFATDNEAGGKKIGEALLAELNKKGITSGKIGVIGVNPATESCNSREKGFRSAFTGTNFTLLETQYCDGDATRSKEAADNFIAQVLTKVQQ